MAQHISIKNSCNKEFKTIYESICRNFEKGISLVQFSLKFQEIFDESYKEFESDKVFITWRNFKNIREAFEIHFDLQKNEVFEIYLVK